MHNPHENEVVWALNIVRKYYDDKWRIFAIEQSVDILDEFGEVITQGTIDLVLERDGQFLIIDWKTGDKSDYSAQLGAYLMAWRDLHHEAKSVSGRIAYVDLRETVEVNIPYDQAAARVLDLYGAWSHRDHPSVLYFINENCSWCARRGDCPAWRANADLVLAEPRFLDLDIDHLKNHPQALEAFLLAWDRCKTLVEDEWALRSVLKTHMEIGHRSDHYTLVTVKDKIEVNKTIDPDQYLQKIPKLIGTMNAALAVKVDADKALTVWRAWTGDPFPLEIKETIMEKPGYAYVRLKGKPGRGEAAKKRKELE